MSVQETRPTWKPVTKETAQGYTKAKYLTDEQLDGILDLIAEGVPQHDAALKHGTSNTQFSRRCKQDPALERRRADALEEGKPMYEDALRAEVYFQAFLQKNYKAVRDLALIHLPEFAPLHTQQFKIGNIDGESFKMAALKQLGPVSDEDLKVLIDIFERQQAELPPAGEV